MTELKARTIVVALGGGAVLAIVAFNQNRSSPVIPAEASASSTVTFATEPGATVYDSTVKSRTPANADRTSTNRPRAIIASVEDGDRILVDVPDNKMNHADLEDFLAKRPMEAYRIVQVDSDALRAVIRQVKQQPTFELQLLSTSSVTLVARDAEEHSSGWQSGIADWRGTVAGQDYSHATFVVAPDGLVHGNIRSRETGWITVEPIPNTPYHIVWQLQEGFSQKID